MNVILDPRFVFVFLVILHSQTKNQTQHENNIIDKITFFKFFLMD